MNITIRQENLLDKIISIYIRSAEPISSSLLEKIGQFKVSSATIRSEMNELEHRGYLVQLHTSSGRIPTDRAYRRYVNNLIENSNFEPEPDIRRKIRYVLHNAGDNPREVSKTVAQLLSNLSDNLVITNIAEADDFYKTGLSSLFELPEFREFDKAFRLTSFFDEFENLFDKIERVFFTEIPGDRDSIERAKAPLNKKLLRDAREPSPRNDIKRVDNNFKIIIGKENTIADIRDESVILARYNLPNDHTGSLTLIGPTRMDYKKNIGLIKCVTGELNKLSRLV